MSDLPYRELPQAHKKVDFEWRQESSRAPRPFSKLLGKKSTRCVYAFSSADTLRPYVHRMPGGKRLIPHHRCA